MGVYGFYQLNLDCETKSDRGGTHFTGDFSEATKVEAYREARKAGWSINERAGKAYCPACAKARWEASLKK